MRTLIEMIAGLAILANAVIYGTDVFGAMILRPAIATVDDRTSPNCSATSTASPTAASRRPPSPA
jgi:hypothetical protein